MKDESGILTILILAITLALQSSIALAAGKRKQAEAKALFQAAYAASGIEAKGSAPFYLKAQFKFDNANFQLTNGSYGETWMSPDQHKTSFSVPSGSDLIGVSNGKRWQESTLPYTTYLETLVKLAIGFGSTLKSGPPRRIKRVKDELSGTRHLTCVIPGKRYKGVFCFDPQNGRLVRRTDGTWDVSYNYSDYEPWGGKVFPRKIQIVQNGSPLVRIAVKSLKPAGRLNPSTFEPPPGAEVEKQVSCRHSQLKGGKLIKQPRPTYPESSKRARMEGIVELYVDIGKQGQVHGVRVVRSASTALDASALRAVRQWRYQPSLCKGVPVDVITSIDVNFRLR